MENKGFTLIELLIVIAIIGILAAIAVPSYQAHVIKANRIDVQLAMTEMSLVAEREYARQGSYSVVAASIVSSYSLELTKPSVSEFLITATAQGNQTSDECGDMTIIQTGLATASLPSCW